ncbi:hypothetical protein GWK77_03185 [Candidatus Saccharibacteria bacterium oral taxon 488]|nr:hypothetical protein GWK77_03185 [Candidatus Saccharibacteria bacterium oral taxon 488]
MSEVSENIYPLLVEHSIHDRMEDCEVSYSVVGGLGLHAVTNAAEIDWDNHVVYLPGGVCLPCLRENGTVRDLDTLVQSTDKVVVKGCQREMTDAIGDKLVISTFGLNPYKKNRRGIFDFVGDRYIDDEGRLYWRLGGIETEIPSSSLDQWLVKKDGETVCAILNPIAQLGAYGCRSITGWRPKDTEKVEELVNVIMPNHKISDIPQDCRDQYYTFREQSKKLPKLEKS